MKVGSLFSGIGGIEIGFEKQGFETEWFVECEPYAKAILRKRFPNSKIYDDITKIDFKTVPEVDILTGGFPCQDISNAGKGVGIEGSRSSLWKYFLKAISTLRPKFALIENVSALLGRGLDVVLCDLAKIGYDAEWYCVSASSVGANHQRERVFIIAYPNSNRKSDESVNEREGQRVVDEVSDSSGFRRDNRGNNRKERHLQAAEERGNQKDKSEWDGRKHRSGEICEDVSNTHSQRCEPCRSRTRPQERDIERGSSREEFISSRSKQNWTVEPRLGRVANGIPNRVDRIKCLGNAVVPQVAEVFAEAIKMTELTLLTENIPGGKK